MNWKYWVSRNVEANNAKYVIVIVADAAEKRGLRKNFTSSIGLGVVASHTANAARNTAPTTIPTTTLVDDQPLSGPSITPKRSAPRPMIDVTAPTGSSGLSCGSREFSTK